MERISLLRSLFLVWMVGAALVAGLLAARAFDPYAIGEGGAQTSQAAFFGAAFMSLLVHVPLLIVVLMLERIAREQATSLARIEAHLGTAPQIAPGPTPGPTRA